MNGPPPGLPPFREVNHKIDLIDKKQVYNYRLPQCPDAYKDALLKKLERYIENGWWEEKSVPQAAPMMVIPKKSGDI
jgi:hypothetical protein